jgi:hypothetical protein
MFTFRWGGDALVDGACRMSADDPNLKAWRAMVEPTIAVDDEPALSQATKLIIAVAVLALGVPIGAAIAAWVMQPS